MAKKGTGRRTRQYNPGAKSLGAYVTAAVSHRRGAHDAGGKVIHETPPGKRSEFARQIWALRRRFESNPEQFTHEHIAAAPRGWRVRTVSPDGVHLVRMAFPPGARRKGAGQVVSVLHPMGENPLSCNRQGLHLSLCVDPEASAPGSVHSSLCIDPDFGSPALAGLVESNPGVDAYRDAMPHISHGDLETLTDAKRLAQLLVNRGFSAKDATAKAQTIAELARAELARRIAALESNPSSHAYMLAAKKAVQAGLYTKAQKLVHKAAEKFKKEDKAWKEKAAKFPRYNPLVESILAGGAGGAAAMLTANWLAQRSTPQPNRAASGKEAIVAEAVGKARALGRAWWQHWTYHLTPEDRAQFANEAEFERLAEKAYKLALANPAKAAAMFKAFHGRNPSEVLELQDALVQAGDYTALGDDPEVWLRPVTGDPSRWGKPDLRFKPADQVKLITDAAGGQLFFVGANQAIPDSVLQEEGYDVTKRFLSLGEAHAISYTTEKVFDGYKTLPYAHRLGEETGERPALIYDRETARLFLVGGAYRIAPVDAGLGASPGIVN